MRGNTLFRLPFVHTVQQGVPTVQCNGVLGFIVTLYIYIVVLYCNPSESFVLPTNSCLLIWSYLHYNRTTSERCEPPRRCCQQRAHATSTTHAPFHHSSLSSVLTVRGHHHAIVSVRPSARASASIAAK